MSMGHSSHVLSSPFPVAKMSLALDQQQFARYIMLSSENLLGTISLLAHNEFVHSWKSWKSCPTALSRHQILSGAKNGEFGDGGEQGTLHVFY